MTGKTKIRIKAVGDIAPGDYMAPGLGILSTANRYGCDFIFKNIRTELGASDLLLGNLEGPLSHLSMKQDMRMCGMPDMALSLKNVGFDVLSVANNHVLDHGPDIFQETLYHCRQAGLMVCGLRGDGEYYSQPVITERNGTKIGILAYNWVSSEHIEIDGSHISQVYDGVVNYSWSRNRDRDVRAREAVAQRNKHVVNDIKALRRHVDILVIMPHWGYEWVIYPPIGVVLEARSFIDAGADLILGSHPHVHQGLEIYNNKIIAYSLGNFLFDGFSKRYGSGMLINCVLSLGGPSEYDVLILDRDDFFRPCSAIAGMAEKHMAMVQKSCSAIADPGAEHWLDDDLIYKEHEKVYNKLKYDKILFLLKTALRHPSTIGVVGQKVLNFLRIIGLRLQGKKVRW